MKKSKQFSGANLLFVSGRVIRVILAVTGIGSCFSQVGFQDEEGVNRSTTTTLIIAKICLLKNYTFSTSANGTWTHLKVVFFSPVDVEDFCPLGR